MYVLIPFHSRYVFCPLSRLFVRVGFRFFCARLAVYSLAFWLFSLWELLKLSKLNGNECNGCVSVRYNSLFISLPLFTKGHKTTK